MVSPKPPMVPAFWKEAIQAAYFSSQLRPLFSPQARPAWRAAGVSRSSHWFSTVQTDVEP
jgi:hypothetical protein